jgi:transcriptional regulator with XRE-family HTH domain
VKYLALGERIKVLRERKGLSLEALAEKTGLDQDKIKRIEANEEQPIIATLIALSKALGVNVADIFRERPVSKSFEILREGQREKVRPLVNPSKARIFDYTYELLTSPSDDKHLESYLIELPPHQSKRPHTDVTHEGEEFVYLLEGELHGEIAGQNFKMKVGDSLFLRSTTPHIFFNPTDKPVRAIAVIYPY